MALPPGPRLPGLLQSVVFLSAQMTMSNRWARRYGDVFTLRGLGFGKLIVVSDPDLVKQIFTGDSTALHGGEGNWILKPIVGENSVLVLDEAEHMRQRKLMLPSFHGDRMRVYGDLIEEIANAEIDRWPRGEPFALHPSMQTMTLHVILRAIFGIDEGAELAELEQALRRALDVNQLYFVVPYLQRNIGPWRAHAQFQRAIAAVDRVLFAEIARRRGDDRLDQREDVLSRLLIARDEDGNAMSDQEVRDELLTLLIAGHETTATALAWLFERLLRHPAALARCRDDPAYLEAAIRESLRVRPILHFAMRKATRPLRLGDYDVPEGATIGASAYLMHRRAEVYPDPDAFRPERYLERRSDTYTWLPFGGGIRRCLGSAFALFEMEVIARTILARTDLSPVEARSERPRRRGLTFVPAKGAAAIAR
jgi:cytochrome P450 family 135